MLDPQAASFRVMTGRLAPPPARTVDDKAGMTMIVVTHEVVSPSVADALCSGGVMVEQGSLAVLTRPQPGRRASLPASSRCRDRQGGRRSATLPLRRHHLPEIGSQG